MPTIVLQAKPLYIHKTYARTTVSNLYGTEIEIWAGFGPVGYTEKINWANYEQLLRAVFHVFMGNFFFK